MGETLEEFAASQPSTKCGVCCLPDDHRGQVDNALASGSVSKPFILKWLARDDLKVTLGMLKHHVECGHHLGAK